MQVRTRAHRTHARTKRSMFLVVATTLPPATVVAQIVHVLIDKRNLPLFIHCLDGSHTTGIIPLCAPLHSLPTSFFSFITVSRLCFACTHHIHTHMHALIGVVVMVLRKLQHWSLSLIFSEFTR